MSATRLPQGTPVWSPWTSPASDPNWLVGSASGRLIHPEHGPLEVRAAEVLYARARPDRMTLLYRLDLAAGDHVWPDRLVTGFVVSPLRLADEHQAQLAAARVEPDSGPAVTSLPEADLVLVAYPNERRLRVPTAERIEAACARHQRALSLDGPVGSVAIELLRYVPTKRWTARVRVESSSGPRTFVVKHYAGTGRAKAVGGRLEALRSVLSGSGGGSSVPFTIPRVLATDPELDLAFLEALPGVSLESALPTLDIPQTLTRSGAALAALHGLSAKGLESVTEVVTPRSQQSDTQSASRTIAWALANLEPGLREIVAGLEAELPGTSEPESLLHGSFRMNHIFVHGTDLALIDLDGLARGPAEYDIANFLSSLYYLEAEGRLTAARRRQVARALLDGYGAAAGRRVSARVVLWFLAALLVEKQALKCATRPGDDRTVKTMSMLNRAENTLQSLRNCGANAGLPDVNELLP